MNRKILQKVIDALKADKKEYAMGILDTLIESEPELHLATPPNLHNAAMKIAQEHKMSGTINGQPITDEGAMIEAETRAKLRNVNLSAVQTENA